MSRNPKILHNQIKKLTFYDLVLPEIWLLQKTVYFCNHIKSVPKFRY